MKKFILGFFVASIIFIGAGVVAYNYKSEDITYTPSDNGWNVNNVKDAVDELYTKMGNGYIKSVATGVYLYPYSGIPIVKCSYINEDGSYSLLKQVGTGSNIPLESDIVDISANPNGGPAFKIKKAGYYLGINPYSSSGTLQNDLAKSFENGPVYLNVDDIVGFWGGTNTYDWSNASMILLYLGESNPFE